MPVLERSEYSAPLLFANSHLATLLPHFMRWTPVKYERERIDTFDGDFIDLDHSHIGADRICILVHGVGGDSRKTYMRGMAKALNSAGWDVTALNLRGCSGVPNRKKRFYHGADSPDLKAALEHMMATGRYKKASLIGFSLGANIVLRFLGEEGDNISDIVSSAVAFSVPCDLGSSADHLSTGSRKYYMKFFLSSFKKKLALKEKNMPGTFDMANFDRDIKSFRDFDNKYNVPWYGFKDRDEFYAQTSSKPYIPNIKVPTLIVNAQNDPFLPEACYPVEEASRTPDVFLEMPKMGGHVGFFTFSWIGRTWSEKRAVDFLEDHRAAIDPALLQPSGWSSSGDSV